MASRSPARWMAPLALIAALVAVGLVVSSTTGGSEDGSPASSTSTGSESRTSTSGRTRTSPRTTTATPTDASDGSGPERYTVKSGDTLGSIAESTGVSVAELQELNPTLDPQSLTVGQRIRLRR